MEKLHSEMALPPSVARAIVAAEAAMLHEEEANSHESVGQLVVQPVCKTGAFGRWGFDSLPAHLEKRMAERCQKQNDAVQYWFCSEAFNLADAGSIPVRVATFGRLVQREDT